MDPSFLSYRQAAACLKARLTNANIPMPVVGIICGSGLSGLSAALTSTVTVPYGEIDGFPASCGVVGHAGEICFGLLSGVPTMCFRGRFHSYEGHSMETVVLPVRVMRCLGVKIAVVTNAAGGLNPSYNVGDVINVMDHFALPMLAGKNPLIGPNDADLGPRFPPTSNAYDPELQAVVLKAAESLGYSDFVRKDGTYCFVSGPMYESRSECKFLRNLGGDSVGMSTVPEIVAAHHSGMKVVCLSLVTNKVVIAGDEGPAASHQEVLEAVEKRSNQIQGLVKEAVKMLDESGALKKLPELPPIDLNVKAFANASSCSKSEVIMGTPLQWIAMGGAMVALGAFLGFKLRRA